MPLVRHTLAAVAAALFIGGAAIAQPTAPSNASPDSSPPASDQSAAPPTDNAQPAQAPNANAATAAAANTSANVDSGAVRVIASQPVPDTPANRAKYGQPMSRAGQHTPAVGN